jgi:threonine/homoserine/homoserine lactone efflux protein
MTSQQLIAFVVFSVVAAGTPGPSNTVLLATGAQVGVLRGLPTLVGQVVGMGLLMTIVGLGLGSLILSSTLLLAAFKWGGAALLCWLAWQIATAGPLHDGSQQTRQLGFFGAAAFQWLNPKAWLVAASAVATFLDSAATAVLTQALAFGVVFAIVALPSCLPWLAFGAAMQRLLRTPRTARLVNVTMGALLAGSALVFVL